VGRTRLYFVTDVHGSDKCFRKFLNAGKVYGAGVLVLGGDITGKLMVTVVKKPYGTYEADYTGEKVSLRTAAELEAALKEIKDIGYYPLVCDSSQVEEFNAKPDLVKETFNRLMVEDIRRWVSLAEERLKGTGTKCYISPGNDDITAIVFPYLKKDIYETAFIVKKKILGIPSSPGSGPFRLSPF
jgi:Icc-related predicted phosphoesterase